MSLEESQESQHRSQACTPKVVMIGDRAGLVEWGSAGWRELIGVPLQGDVVPAAQVRFQCVGPDRLGELPHQVQDRNGRLAVLIGQAISEEVGHGGCGVKI